MTAAALSPAARRDLLEAVNWIARDNPGAARALRRNVAKTAVVIAEHPDVGSPRPEIVPTPFRYMALTGFPYIVVYHSDRGPPVIARIPHGGRDLPEVLRDF
jgi:toxin ParE1/3/4